MKIKVKTNKYNIDKCDKCLTIRKMCYGKNKKCAAYGWLIREDLKEEKRRGKGVPP